MRSVNERCANFMKFESDKMAIRCCPVCNATGGSATLFLEGNYDENKLSEFSFASRKLPEFMCHRLMRCTICDVVYVDQPPSGNELSHAYHTAEYDSSEEADDAAKAYIKALTHILDKVKVHDSVLEIGTGTGVFLEYMAKVGFNRVVGIEPSKSAILAAPAHRQAWIKQGMFNGADFEDASFDLVCCFMTMDHVLDPTDIIKQVHRLLRSGGAFVAVTHDYQSVVNRLLGRKSPIIDIEHMQLFSKKSLRYLYEKNNFIDIQIENFVNTYALRYWLRLMPLPLRLKNILDNFISKIGLQNKKISINLGNLISVGFKK